MIRRIGAVVLVAAAAVSIGLAFPRCVPAQSSIEALIGNAVSDPNNGQYQEVGRAISRFSQGDIVAARTLLEATRERFPKLPPVEIMMAKLFATAGQNAAARAELERAVNDHPNDPDAYLILAESALGDRRWTEADLVFRKAKELTDSFDENPKRKRDFALRANRGLATVAEARADWGAAVAPLQALTELDPDNAVTQIRLGRALFHTKKANEAYRAFQNAGKLDTKSRNADVLMAELYQQAEDKAQAAKFMEYAAQQNPNSAEVQVAAAGWALGAGELDAAASYADAALKAEPGNADAKFIRAQIARMKGALPEAQKLLEEAHLAAPANLHVSNALALVLADQAEPKSIRRGLELAQVNRQATTEGTQLNPDLTATYAWLLFRSGKAADAELELSRIAGHLGSVSPESQYNVARILAARGARDGSIKLLETALKSRTPFPGRHAAEESLAALKGSEPDN